MRHNPVDADYASYGHGSGGGIRTHDLGLMSPTL